MKKKKTIGLPCRQQPNGNAGDSFDSWSCVEMAAQPHTHTRRDTNLLVPDSEVNRRAIVQIISRKLNRIKSTLK